MTIIGGAKCSANAFPIPEEAPVIRAVRFKLSIFRTPSMIISSNNPYPGIQLSF